MNNLNFIYPEIFILYGIPKPLAAAIPNLIPVKEPGPNDTKI